MAALVESIAETTVLWRDTSDAVFPYYEQYGRRCASFLEHDTRQDTPCDNDDDVTTTVTTAKAHTLAANGFFYGGVCDVSICFQCGVALRNWHLVKDAHVYREHMYWHRGCSRYSNVTAFAANYSPRTIPAIRHLTRYNMASSARLRVRYAMLVDAGNVLRRELKSFRYFANLVAKTSNEIAATLETAVHSWEKARAIMECLSYHRSDDKSTGGGYSRLESQLIDSIDRLNVARGRATSAAAGAAAAATVDDDNEGGEAARSVECAVCYGNARDIVLLPCRHFVACTDCAGRLATCPLCRTAIWLTVAVKWG